MRYVITAPDGYYTIQQLADLLHLTKKTMERLIVHWQLERIKYKNRWHIIHNDNHALFKSLMLIENCPLKPLYSASELAKAFGFSKEKVHMYLDKYAILIHKKRYWFLSDLRDRLNEFPKQITTKRSRKH